MFNFFSEGSKNWIIRNGPFQFYCVFIYRIRATQLLTGKLKDLEDLHQYLARLGKHSHADPQQKQKNQCQLEYIHKLLVACQDSGIYAFIST